jgi:hypothetical protein
MLGPSLGSSRAGPGKACRPCFLTVCTVGVIITRLGTCCFRHSCLFWCHYLASNMFSNPSVHKPLVEASVPDSLLLHAAQAAA